MTFSHLSSLLFWKENPSFPLNASEDAALLKKISIQLIVSEYFAACQVRMVSFTHSVLSETVSPHAAQGGKHPFLWFNFKDTLEINKGSPVPSGGSNGGPFYSIHTLKIYHLN